MTDGFPEDFFEFTMNGRGYTVAPVPWPVYRELIAANVHAANVEAGRAKPEDGPEDKPIIELAPVVLGEDVLEQLAADGVPGPKIMLAARAAYLFQIGNAEVAQALLDGQGKATTPASTSTSTTPTGSTSTASASATPRRASSTGTRSRTTSKPRSRGTKAAR